MYFPISFILNSTMLGIGLAMDAFSVSMANGLNNPTMHKKEMYRIAGCFAFFQWFMPMVGWLCIHTIVIYFKSFQLFIPWIALLLLSYIGGKMIYEGIIDKDDCEDTQSKDQYSLSSSTLIMQGIATSIDALSVGFTIANYHLIEAMLASIIISLTTFIICCIGLKIGRVAGTKLSNKADILGGAILIFIGLEIFITKVFL